MKLWTTILLVMLFSVLLPVSAARADELNSADVDGDGLLNGEDNAPAHWNPNQCDTDSDGVGDVADNAPVYANLDQTDDDGDGIGNAGDPTLQTYDPVQLTADINGPYVVTTGQPLDLHVSGLSIRPDGVGVGVMLMDLDLDDDGLFLDAHEMASSATVTLSWADVQAAGLDLPGSHTITLRVRTSYAGPVYADTTVTPEPATLSLLALGGLALLRKRRKQ